MSRSESRLNKIEFMRVHPFKKCDYRESLHITMKPEFVCMKTSLVVVIFIG